MENQFQYMTHKATVEGVQTEVIFEQQAFLFKTIKDFPATKTVMDRFSTELYTQKATHQ